MKIALDVMGGDFAPQSPIGGVKLALGANVDDPADPMGKMFFNILATFAEFEADLIRLRTREGATGLVPWLIGKYGRGAALAGFLGGLVSSTATTASLARRSRDRGACGICLAAIALIASAVVFVRVIVEVVIAAPGHMGLLLPPLLAMMAWFGLVAAVSHRLSEKQSQHHTDEPPPSELKSAVLFGLLYAVVLVVVAAARQHWGNSGLYAAAALSGLTDMDAITLSTARLVSTGNLEAATGWRMILLGGMANMAFKMALAMLLGARAFVKPVLTGFSVALVGGVLILALWP